LTQPTRRDSSWLLPALLLSALAGRFGIDLWLRSNGYFYGAPWDTFSRTDLSFQWSRSPYFAPSDGYWLPLQFWIVGSLFRLIHPWISYSEILVPVAVNHLLFLGSLALLYRLSRRAGGRAAGGLAVLLATVFSGDVLITYSGLCEPFLVFFILWASIELVGFWDATPDARPGRALRASVPALLSAATHYIGWFLAVFVALALMPDLLRSVRDRRFRWTATFVVASLLCAMVPTIWLLNSVIHFGDPLHPMRAAKTLQADYMGQMPFAKRLIVPWRALVRHYWALAVPGALAALWALFRRPRLLSSVAPAAFVFAWIWVTTALSFSAPYEEPRYFVFFVWALLPVLSAALVSLPKRWGGRGIAASGLAVALMVVASFASLKWTKNSFGPEVERAAQLARVWLHSHPDGRVSIEARGYAESGVIPVVAGDPRRFAILSQQQMEGCLPNLASCLGKGSSPWLAILYAEESRAPAGRDEGRIGPYRIVSGGR
jgi:hypothetical protein